MADNITFFIDNQQIVARKGETILEAALRSGIQIPNLCYNKKVSHTASCRLCVVRIEGRPGGIPSCTALAEEGMKVTVFNEDLEKIRRTVLDLALSNHNDDCISCVRDGSCELQDLAFRYNLGKEERRFPPIWEELNKTSDYSSQVLDYDASKCIQCNRCIKACHEIQGKGILSFVNRGIRTTVGTGYSCWSDSKCDGCGECAQICPVGAITTKHFYGKISRVRTKDAERKVQTTCPYCGVGCQLEISTRKFFSEGKCGVEDIIEVSGANDVPNFGSTCVKGRFGLDFVSHSDRLKTPLIRKNGKFEPASWSQAIRLIARKLDDIRGEHGVDAIAGLASARCTNEENFVFQKFIRSAIGTNNVDHCARLCHASTVSGLADTLGSGAMTNSIAELKKANVIVVIGSNTTEAHPVIATAIKQAVLFNNAKLIVIDPRKIDLVRFATLWLRQNHGSDVALINGLIQVILSNSWHNQKFIDINTEQFEAMRNTVSKYDLRTVESLTGVASEKLVKAAQLYAKAPCSSIVYSMGITQHSHGVDNVKSLSNLALVCGQIGRESTGINPLRGQNNVQGACDMGALPNLYPGYQKVDDPSVREKFEAVWERKLSAKPGLSVVEIMNSACEGKIKALYIMGENPMVSDPNLNHVKEALQKIDFLVVQDIFLTETAQLAHVVLPSCSALEKQGTFTNTERRVMPVNKVLSGPGETRQDWEIVQSLARAMGYLGWDYTSAASILNEINQLVPQYAGITAERIATGEKLQWPCPNSQHPGTPYLHKQGIVRGKGLFAAIDYLPSKELPDAEYPFVLSTGRILFHYHTCSMTRRTKALPQYVNEAYIEISAEDAGVLGIASGEKVSVSSRRGNIVLNAKITDRVKKGNTFIPFHFAEAAANILTIDAVDPIAKIPEFKVCAVNIKKS